VRGQDEQADRGRLTLVTWYIDATSGRHWRQMTAAPLTVRALPGRLTRWPSGPCAQGRDVVAIVVAIYLAAHCLPISGRSDGIGQVRRSAGPPRRAALRAVPRQRSRPAAWSRGVPGRLPNEATNTAGLAGILGGPGSRYLVIRAIGQLGFPGWPWPEPEPEPEPGRGRLGLCHTVLLCERRTRAGADGWLSVVGDQATFGWSGPRPGTGPAAAVGQPFSTPGYAA
jgi:hypothetical protein